MTFNVSSGKKAAQHSVHPTGGIHTAKGVSSVFGGFSVKSALSRPSHLRVTQAVGWFPSGEIHAKGENRKNLR